MGVPKLPNFRIFAHFPHTKRLNLFVYGLQPRGYIGECFRLLPCDAMHSEAIAVTRCLSVRPSVRHVREFRQNE